MQFNEGKILYYPRFISVFDIFISTDLNTNTIEWQTMFRIRYQIKVPFVVDSVTFDVLDSYIDDTLLRCFSYDAKNEVHKIDLMGMTTAPYLVL